MVRCEGWLRTQAVCSNRTITDRVASFHVTDAASQAGVGYATVAITGITLIFGEILPKSLAVAQVIW